ncbi:hypothetical protein [Reyranella soli]|uniref:Uncharacterized protein n=1 Tax=Reyranella soli TaxID=1230389 RepID=A0A512N6N3_9HYPH|nr:hypothetical protein [Reyranella soli]GEP54645.1 hypothetical protein RSO01_18110 [Reyranella soli]
MLDMLKGNGLQVLDNEFLAYLAEAISDETLGYTTPGTDVSGLAAELAVLVVAASKTKALVEIEWFDKAVEFDGKVQNPVLCLREATRHDPTYITSWWTRYRDDGI